MIQKWPGAQILTASAIANDSGRNDQTINSHYIIAILFIESKVKSESSEL